MTAIDVVLVAARLAIGCWLLWSVPRLVTRPDGRSGQSDLAGVAVVVPARDEALSIGTLLGSLPAGPEVVVVDDDSTDATAAVATAAGARVMRSRPLPAGWVGKTWACAQGVAATTGDPVVLVDADVRFGPGGLAAAVGEQRDRGGLVSVQPFHEPGTPAESLASIFNIVGFAGTDAASPLGRIRGVRGAFGPVLVTSRADLESVGGHEAIRTSVVDDVALAERYRAAGLPVTVLGGGDLVRFRMYPGGFGAMTEGFTKNLAAGAASVRPGTVALVVAWMSLLVQAAVGLGVAVLGGGSLGGGSLGGGSLGAATVLYLVVAAQLWWMGRRLGRFGPWLALAFPLSVVLFLAVFARSVWATATGSVSWRGRRVSTRRR